MRREPTRKRIVPLLTVGGLVALALGAGTVIGGIASKGPGNLPAPDAAELRASAGIERVAAKGGQPSRIVYFETTGPLPAIPPGPGGYIFRQCPKGSVAVNGYYYQQGPDGKDPDSDPDGVFEGFGLDDQGSSPAGYRRWAFYWDNQATDPGGQPMALEGVTAGIICDKDG